MQYLFRGPKKDLQGFIAAKGLPAYAAIWRMSLLLMKMWSFMRKRKLWSGVLGWRSFFQVLFIGKKRVHILITSGLFTTWLSCPTDVCFGSEQHEHMTGRQTIIPRSFIPLAFHMDLVTLYQTPVWVFYSLFFGKSNIVEKYVLNLVSSCGSQRIKPSSGRYLQIASNCHSWPDDVHQDGRFTGISPAEIFKEN